MLGFLTFGLLCGFCTGDFLAVWDPPPAFCGLGNVKVYSKVRPTPAGAGFAALQAVVSVGGQVYPDESAAGVWVLFRFLALPVGQLKLPETCLDF